MHWNSTRNLACAVLRDDNVNLCENVNPLDYDTVYETAFLFIADFSSQSLPCTSQLVISARISEKMPNVFSSLVNLHTKNRGAWGNDYHPLDLSFNGDRNTIPATISFVWGQAIQWN